MQNVGFCVSGCLFPLSGRGALPGDRRPRVAAAETLEQRCHAPTLAAIGHRRGSDGLRFDSRPEIARTQGSYRFGFWIAIITVAVTVVTFALALTALPNSVPYPFTSHSIAEQWPMDYLWMYPAMVLMLLFVALFAAIHEYAPPARKIYSLLGLGVAVIAAAVLLIDYYIQVTVMQPSLEKGQLDGWAMLTQYNPNGVFIALEEIGYLLMSLVLLCLARVFVRRTARAGLRWLFTLSFAAAILALVIVSAFRGIDRGDASSRSS